MFVLLPIDAFDGLKENARVKFSFILIIVSRQTRGNLNV